MNDMRDDKLDEYYKAAESWADERTEADGRASRIALIVAGVATTVALLEAIALVLLIPLKIVEPYTLLVDRQTGFVQALKPLESQSITPDAALIRSFLVQYVIAREGFDIDAFKSDYRKVALWSAEAARSSYLSQMQATNPASPLASLPRRALVGVEIRSVSPLNADTAMVRFSSARTDPGGQPQPPQLWVAILKYRFSGAAMSEADRLLNPLGFQVVRYHRDAEMIQPEQPAALPQQSPAQIVSPPVQPSAASSQTVTSAKP